MTIDQQLPHLLEEGALRIVVIGLGYVGLPLAYHFAAAGLDVIGYDINEDRVKDLIRGVDNTECITPEQLSSIKIDFTVDASRLREAHVIIVAVPTDINPDKQPNLVPLTAAARDIAQHATSETCIIIESTVYPGATEEVVMPIVSGLPGQLWWGYSPERVVPGRPPKVQADQRSSTLHGSGHTLTNTNKVVSGCCPESAEFIKQLYERVITDAKVHVAPSIKTAEASKILENCQRDLNIALINEFALICNRLGIETQDVLEAAGTKFNFHPYTPGLVGGHCIPIDPYYMAYRAKLAGFHTNVILAGRQVNDRMGVFIARETIKKLCSPQTPNTGTDKILVYGWAFKPDCPDWRNTRTIDIVRELEEFGYRPVVVDPMVQADHDIILGETGIDVVPVRGKEAAAAAIIATPHTEIIDDIWQSGAGVRAGGVVTDVHGRLKDYKFSQEVTYWCL